MSDNKAELYFVCMVHKGMHQLDFKYLLLITHPISGVAPLMPHLTHLNTPTHTHTHKHARAHFTEETEAFKQEFPHPSATKSPSPAAYLLPGFPPGLVDEVPPPLLPSAPPLRVLCSQGIGSCNSLLVLHPQNHPFSWVIPARIKERCDRSAHPGFIAAQWPRGESNFNVHP